ncbi:MAG: ATP-grasp domain-containing protein, partial [Desulfobacteraceae bacterium]|nr:ATP-grasp domain-containing protein [Desulfobacteraceae bacterium]
KGLKIFRGCPAEFNGFLTKYAAQAETNHDKISYLVSIQTKCDEPQPLLLLFIKGLHQTSYLETHNNCIPHNREPGEASRRPPQGATTGI